MDRNRAESIALQAIGFVAEDSDRLGRFLALTGIGPHQLRDQLEDPAFLGGVLDYLLNHEPDLLSFAEWAGIEPSEVGTARSSLPGATQVE